jgi:GDP-L-fucose synthase
MIAIIGARGYLGSALRLRAALEEEPHLALTRNEFDLLGSEVPHLKDQDITTAIYCADYYPGLEYCGQHGDEVFRINTCMYQALYAFAVRNEIKRVITIGTTACYPMIDEPLREDMLDRKVLDHVHPKMRMYAASRYWLFDLAKLYEKSHGIAHVHLIVPNIYGPCDKFDPTRSHLLSSWVRDFHAAWGAHQEHITLWGSPDAKREFMYIDDVASYVFILAKMGLGSVIMNVGTGLTPTYGEIANAILQALNYDEVGRVKWDTSRKNARMSETLDIERFWKWKGGQYFPDPTKFQIGVKRTVDFYMSEVFFTL